MVGLLSVFTTVFRTGDSTPNIVILLTDLLIAVRVSTLPPKEVIKVYIVSL